MADFGFCPNSQVPSTLVRDTNNSVTFAGWTFNARPSSPMQRKFRVMLHGLRWYLNSDGTYDKTTNPTVNAAKLEDFYASYEQWAPFTWQHPHLGLLRVKFAAPVNVPPAIPGGSGWLEPLEIMLVEADAYQVAPPFVGARYWRLQLTGSNGGSYVGASEVELIETPGGADVTGSGTASAFSTFSGLSAANAFDNNNATEWASNGDGLPGSQYLKYDFGANILKNINQVKWRARGSGQAAAQSPTGFKVQYSYDNVTWFDRWIETGITGWTDGLTKTFTRPGA